MYAYTLSSEDADAIRHMFTCMRDNYNWSQDRPAVPDVRAVTKANEEYHGFQRQAEQYAYASMYQEASKYFNEAAALRENIMTTLPQLQDDRHEKAVQMCKRFANYYGAAYDWQQGPDKYDPSKAPNPAHFGLRHENIEKLEADGAASIERARTNYPQFP